MKHLFAMIFFILTANIAFASSFGHTSQQVTKPISYQNVVNGMALRKEGYSPADVIICLAANAHLFAAPEGTVVKVGGMSFFKQRGRWTTWTGWQDQRPL